MCDEFIFININIYSLDSDNCAIDIFSQRNEYTACFILIENDGNDKENKFKITRPLLIENYQLICTYSLSKPHNIPIITNKHPQIFYQLYTKKPTC